MPRWKRSTRRNSRSTQYLRSARRRNLLSEREEDGQPLRQPGDVGCAGVGAQPVQRALVEPAAAVDDHPRQRQGLQIEHGVGKLLVGGAGDALVLRLDRQAVAVARVAEEDVYLAI